MFVETYPHPFHPVDDAGVADLSSTVEVFQLRPGDTSRLADWAGLSGYAGADGGLLLLDDDQVIGRLTLGDFAVRHPDGRLEVGRGGRVRAPLHPRLPVRHLTPNPPYPLPVPCRP